jgi:uncharacterized protein (TIGR03435 family)
MVELKAAGGHRDGERAVQELGFNWPGRCRNTSLNFIRVTAAALVFSIAVQPIHAQPQSARVTHPAFEVASIKRNHSGDSIFLLRVGRPGTFAAQNVTVRQLIAWAYGETLLNDDQLSEGPPWINVEKFDIDAKEEDSEVAQLQKLTPGERTHQLRLRVQALLSDRFKLIVHHETRELPVYALVVAKNGARLTPSTAEPMATFSRGQITATGAPVAVITEALSRRAPTGSAPAELAGREVHDQTGLTAMYNFTLKWNPDLLASVDAADSNGASIFTAIQEQLGLRLVSAKSPVDVLVIDHVEEPSAN